MTGQIDTSHSDKVDRTTAKKGSLVNPLLTKKTSESCDVARALLAFPIFGGEDPPAGAPAGGADPVAELIKDPAKVAQLLTQTQTLSNQVTDLTQKYTEATAKLTGFETEKEQQELAKKSKEEQQDTEIKKRDAQLEKLTNVLNQKLIENAIANNPEYQWQSTRQVQGELDMSKLKINLDIENGIAEIDGMNDQLKEISTRCPWLLKSATTEEQPGGSTAPRPPAGRAPAPPAGKQTKSELHEKAMKRYPSLQGMGAPRF